MRASPSISYCPLPRQTKDVKKRSAVPALPMKNSPSGFSGFPPLTRMTSSLSRVSTGIPIWLSAVARYLESSENDALTSLVMPGARAAAMRARFVRLFEPWTARSRDTDPAGSIWIFAMKA